METIEAYSTPEEYNYGTNLLQREAVESCFIIGSRLKAMVN